MDVAFVVAYSMLPFFVCSIPPFVALSILLSLGLMWLGQLYPGAVVRDQFGGKELHGVFRGAIVRAHKTVSILYAKNLTIVHVRMTNKV